jgi:hypothetical protein
VTEGHVGERAVAYLTGELSGAERESVRHHLARCAACRTELENVETALGAVASWPSEPTLDPAVEERVVGALRGAARRVAHAHPSWWRSPVAAAAIVGLVCGSVGFGAGRATAERGGRSVAAVSADSSLRSYLLLLEEPVWPPARPLARSGYGEWSRAIASQARFVGAEKLTEEPGFRVSAAAVARPDGRERPPNVSGWYVLRARSYDEAIDWARRGPHLAYGSVLVREIETTPRTTR